MTGAAAPPEGPRFLALPDLAGARAGARVVALSDEFFAPAERLLSPAAAVFDPDRYTDRGKWMDGWETRRRRGPGHDWVVVRLGGPTVVRGVDIDTRHFRGNHPDRGALEACLLDGDEARLLEEPRAWTTLVPESPLAPDSPNLFPVSHPGRWTHVRLRIHPDGGVARLRVYGEARPDWAAVTATGGPVDLAALVHGGLVLDSSDAFFSAPLNLLMPGRSAGMMDGWETRRRRGPGHDWVIVRLGAAGQIAALEVDTHHFKGNFPESCSVDALDAPAAAEDDVEAVAWTEILPRTTLSADREHRFEPPALVAAPASHVRLNIYPDGGVSRLRVLGFPRLAGDSA